MQVQQQVVKFDELSEFQWQVATQAFNWASRSLEEKAQMFLCHHNWRYFYIQLCSDTAWKLVMQHRKSNKMLATMILDYLDDNDIRIFLNQETRPKHLSILHLMTVERITVAAENATEEKRRILLQGFDKKEEVLEQLTASQIRRRSQLDNSKSHKSEQPNIYIATRDFMSTLAESARRCSYCLEDYSDLSSFIFRCPAHTVHQSRCSGKGDTPCPACWNYSSV